MRNAPRFFTKLALATALLTLGLIVFGAIVRVTDSGLGCGNDWPRCDGRVIPPLDNLTAWIEWSHRLFAALIGLFGVVMLVNAFRSSRRVLNATLVTAGLFIAQALLGAMVVLLDLPPTMVTLHLGTAMLLLAALLVTAILSWHQPIERYERDHVTLLAYVTTALSLVIILTGALVRGSGATLACTDWPLCNGAAFPFDQGELQIVHMMHRYAVIALGFTLIMLVWYVYQDRKQGMIRTFAMSALAAYLLQACVGAMFVLTSAGSLWGAAHVGLAAITWGFLVTLSTVDTLNTMKFNQEILEWNMPSEAVR